MSEPVNCNNSILLDGDGMAHSDYHENKDIAEEDLLARVTKEVELWSAKKISMYRCPGMCPEKFSNRAIMDIRNIRHHFSPPPGENTAKWSATGSYVWHANLSCS